MTAQRPHTVGILGYGEAGEAFADRLSEKGASVVVTTRSPEAVQAALGPDSSIEVAPDPAAVARQSDVVFSCVWPETAADVAADAADGLDGTLYVDFNSIGVETVREIAQIVDEAGGALLNASIMGSVRRQGADVPIVVSGHPVEMGGSMLREFDFSVESYGPDPERVAVLKMCRSAITKGLLVILAEALLPARAHDLHDEVLDSVDRSFSDQTLGDFARLFLVDMTHHGARRAGELDEVIATIRDGGYDATVSERARWLSQQLSMLEGEDYEEVLARLDEAT